MSCDKRACEIFWAGVKNGYDEDAYDHDPRKWKKEDFRRPNWLDEPLTVTKNPAYHSADEKSAVGSIEKETKMYRTLNMNHELDLAVVKEFCHIEGTGVPTLSHFCFFALFAPAEMGTFGILTKTGTALTVKTIGHSSCRGFETDKYLFIEQNKKKDSEPGRRARQGHHIMWVIQKSPNKYIGKVEDGVLEVLNRK